MKPAPFEYRAPDSVEEVLELLDQHGEEAALLAGGQSLVPTMNFRLAQPSMLIDLNRVRELFFIRPSGSGGLSLGAMTRQRSLERSGEVLQRAPLLHEAMPFIAHPQIRNRGTLGGSLAHADPSAELPAVMIALGARFRLRGKDSDRWIEAGEFFTGMFSTQRLPTELLAEIELPARPPRLGWGFREIARRHGDYALVGVAAALTLDGSGLCDGVRLVFLNAGDGSVEASQAQLLLLGQRLSDEALAEAAETAAKQDIDPLPDVHATAEYRRSLARALAVQALSAARQRAEAAAS